MSLVLRPQRVLYALLAGLVVGIAISLSGSPVLARVVSVVEPIGTLWVNAIRMTVVPLVVSLLITGVASTADSGAVGRLGARSFVTFLALIAIAAVFAVIVGPSLFRWLPVSAEGAAALRASVTATAGQTAKDLQSMPGFAQWLTSLIPANPVRAAADGAMLPLVIFTLAFALATSRLDTDRRAAVVRFFGGVSDAMLVLVRWLIIIAPIGVFALIIVPAARLGVMVAGAIGYYIVASSVALFLFTLVLYPVAMVAARMSLARFARAVWSAQAVAFSSSSSLASLPALVEGAERELGVSPALSGFVLPLAVSTFKVATPITWTVGALFLARLYGIELHFTQLITLAAAALALSFSIPGVPNAAFLIVVPLFVNIGIPPEGVGLLIAADAIPDLFGTMTNVTGDMTACAIVSAADRTARL